MTTKPAKVWLVRDGVGENYVAEYKSFRYRFLLASGKVIDVIARGDGSELREAVLRTQPKDAAIVGVACLGETE